MSNRKPSNPDEFHYKVHHKSKVAFKKQQHDVDALPQIKLKNGTFVNINIKRKNSEKKIIQKPNITITIKTDVSYTFASASITTNTTYLLHPTLGCCTPEEANEALREVNCGAR